MQPLKLWGHPKGPNPLKILIVLIELKLPYEIKPVDFASVKQEPFLSMNPNGRMPALEDPNNNLVLWESGAIIEYLIAEYDKEHTLSYDTLPEKWQQHVWKHFQMSGQGPYFGQATWFGMFHPEKLPSAIERYVKEIDRVMSVIELHLSKTGNSYLIGEKCSFADLMFVPWNRATEGSPQYAFLTKEWPEKYPLSYAWNQKLFGRQAVKEAMRLAEETTASH